jgi:hypothetical protein
MKEVVLFSEKQRFTQWWLWAILLGINGIMLVMAYRQFTHAQMVGNATTGTANMLFAASLSGFLTIVFLNFKLETKITNSGVDVRFFPFHLRYKHYPWENLAKVAVRQYNPITEYGGWGIRLGMFGKGKAFNVSGNIGLQLEFSDGSKLLIGTNKPQEMIAALGQIQRLNRDQATPPNPLD